MSDKTTIDLDFNCEYPNLMMDILYKAEDLKGRIVHFKAYGPAGGNPNAIIEMPNRESAIAVLTEYFDGDSDEAIAYLED